MDDNDTLPRRPSPAEIIRQLKENTLPTHMPKPEREREPLKAPEPAEPPSPDGPESFDPDSREYKAYGRSSNKPVPSLRFIRKDPSEFGVSYGHLDTHHPEGCEFIPSAPGKGNIIRLRFAGASVSFIVTLEGRNLRRLWELFMGHLTPWVHEYPAAIDTLAGEATVVKAINFKIEQ